MSADETLENYGYVIDIPSRWADCDAYGHVNNAIYYSWFDTALSTMIIERGVIRSDKGHSIGFCVESQCKFHAPVAFPETIRAGVRIGHLGNKSIRYEIGLFRKNGIDPVATGYFVHVFVDPATHKPVALTEAQKDAVTDLVSA